MHTTIDTEEVAKFAAMAEDWWTPDGKLRPLHQLNPVRLAYIREHVLRHFGRDGATRHPFEGLSMLDIGCGGGILSEPLARLGGSVTGIDASAAAIGAARHHAAEGGLAIDYRETTAEALAAGGVTYDVVFAMEIVEHVDDVTLFMASCARLVRPGGLFFLSSINRTPRAYALAVVAAERILRWLPTGTHDYRKFLTPDEVSALCRRNGLRVVDRAGVSYRPLTGSWQQSSDLGINYMLVAARPA